MVPEDRLTMMAKMPNPHLHETLMMPEATGPAIYKRIRLGAYSRVSTLRPYPACNERRGERNCVDQCTVMEIASIYHLSNVSNFQANTCQRFVTYHRRGSAALARFLCRLLGRAQSRKICMLRTDEPEREKHLSASIDADISRGCNHGLSNCQQQHGCQEEFESTGIQHSI